LQKAAAPIFEPEAKLLKPLYRRSIIETQSETTSGRSSVAEQTLPKLQIQLRRGAPEALHRLAVARRKGNAPQFGLRAELFRMTGTDLIQIDGVDVMTGTTILSEAGWDMSKWKTEDHLFAGYGCARTIESAETRSSGKAGCRLIIESVSL
jgi:hypothetical protein